MGDYFPGRITIGGVLRLRPAPESGISQEDWDDTIDRFLAEVQETSPEFSGDTYSLTRVHDLLKILDEKKQLDCTDSEASYGEFPELEELCRELGLSYDRWSDAKYEYESCVQMWRPGMEKPFDCESNKSEVAVIDRAPVLEAYQLLLSNEGTDVGRLGKIQLILRDALYPSQPDEIIEPSPLPPFTIEN